MYLYVLMLIVSILILWKAADWFVEGAVGFAEYFHVPKMLVGIVLVSLCTTSPELMTSVLATVQGNPELALGNAIGSVSVDVGLALGVAALLSAVPLSIDPLVFRTSAVFVLIALGTGYVLCLDGTMSRADGAILLAMYLGYLAVAFRQFRQHRKAFEASLSEADALAEKVRRLRPLHIALLLGIGFGGVLLGSELLVRSATAIAAALGMSPVIIGLTIAAAGTSTPEIVTCITSVVKRQGQVGVGNIIGADILNVCWVAGVSSIFNPLTAELPVINYMFPGALALVGVMLLLLRMHYDLRRWHGAVILGLYLIFVAGMIRLALSGTSTGIGAAI